MKLEHGIISRAFDAAARPSKQFGQPVYGWSNDLTQVNSM